MISAIITFVIAMLVAVSLTPVVRRVAIGVGAVDNPGGRRIHATVIPRLGGIAIAAAFFLPLLCMFAIETQVAKLFFSHPFRVVGLAIGGLLMCGLGVLDDVHGVRAWHKLWVQAAAGAIAYGCHFRIDGVAIPFLGNLDMGIFGVAVTMLWIVAIINAINLIDGLDGLAGGIAFFACVTNFVVAVINSNPIVMLLSAALGGALLGFLLFNFNPASIFMGDSGSMFLGYVLATTSIIGNSNKSSTAVAILVPLVALGLPIMDTLFAMARRFLERRPIFAPDRGHIHHRLLAMGLTHRRAVILLYGVSIAFTAGAIIVSIGRNWQVGVALVVLSLLIVGVLRAMGNLQLALRRWVRRERTRPASVERLRTAVPSALTRIAATRELGDVQATLVEFAQAARLRGVELQVSPGAPLLGFVWDAPPPSEHPEQENEVEPIEATFEVPGAGASARLTFTWLGERTDIAAEEEILLQLVVDACSARLQRVSEARRVTPAERLQPVN